PIVALPSGSAKPLVTPCEVQQSKNGFVNLVGIDVHRRPTLQCPGPAHLLAASPAPRPLPRPRLRSATRIRLSGRMVDSLQKTRTQRPLPTLAPARLRLRGELREWASRQAKVAENHQSESEASPGPDLEIVAGSAEWRPALEPTAGLAEPDRD